MSKINELIQTLCPDGVEYKKLGEVGCVRMCKRIMKDQTSSTGDIPFYKIGTFGGTANAYITQELFDEYSSKYNYPKKGNILISAAGTIGRTVVFDGKPSYFQDSNIVWLEHDGTQVTDEYLKYIYSTSPWYVADGGTISRLYNDNILNAVIPVPPLPVQDEIVRILDEYTELEAELEAKLSEEIELKQKQYEVYRARLLNDDSYDGYTLPEISENCDSQRKPITSSQRVSGSTPYYGASGIVDYVDDYIFDGEYLLISEDGANLLARSTPIAFSISGKTWVNNHAHILKFESYYTQKWVEYYFNSIDLSLYITGGAQPKLNQKNLNKIVIPVPSPTEQERIVKILDKYDTYTRDMISTLNTELESRKKQYAYYRDQLLTFKRKEV